MPCSHWLRWSWTCSLHPDSEASLTALAKLTATHRHCSPISTIRNVSSCSPSGKPHQNPSYWIVLGTTGPSTQRPLSGEICSTNAHPPQESKTKNHLRPILHQRTGRGSRVLVNHVQGSGSYPHHHPTMPRVKGYGLRKSELLSRNTEHYTAKLCALTGLSKNVT